MKNKLILFFLCLLAGLNVVRGQDHPQAPSQEEIIAAINRSASMLRSLQCDFVQTKELSLLQDRMVSRGVMYYRQEGGKLHWEYQTPYHYTFILNGNRVMVRSGERTDVIETSGNRMFREIARIMMNSLTGKCLSDTSDFEVRISTNAGRRIAELTPRRREMEQFFSRVRLHFDPDRQLVTRVEMIEKNGDRTVIDLKNLKTDATIDENVFAVD